VAKVAVLEGTDADQARLLHSCRKKTYFSLSFFFIPLNHLTIITGILLERVRLIPAVRQKRTHETRFCCAQLLQAFFNQMTAFDR
jgi:hypothetical protein